MVQVDFSKKAQKQLKKAPLYIVDAVLKWVYSIEEFGLFETRRMRASGLHDEPLLGEA